MTNADDNGGGARGGKDPKAAAKARRDLRLAEALRANLKRRKAASARKPAGPEAEPKKP